MKRKILFAFFVLVFALSSVAASGSVLRAKKDFMLLYDSKWKLQSLNYRLFATIDKEFSEAGISLFQFAFNRDEVIKNLLSDIFAKLQPEYEFFFQDVYEKYYDSLKVNTREFSTEKIKTLLDYEKVASTQPEVRQQLLDNIGDVFDNHYAKRISRPTFSLMLFIIGVVLIIIKDFIAKLFVKKEKSERRANLCVGIIGVVLIILGVMHFSHGIFFTKGVIREFVNEQAKALYTAELPRAYWEIMEPDIREASLND